MVRNIDKFTKFKTDFIQADPRACTACWKCVRACRSKVIGKVGNKKIN
jgi:NAD-dependent dihydropyrimidine dehydrogenase PreA subunit